MRTREKKRERERERERERLTSPEIFQQNMHNLEYTVTPLDILYRFPWLG